ncbi:MAG: DUF4271 domain-containing protein [Chitinophagaceae bacterium]|nr:DUF4271 domain-containing protein [Chitinophagaceae bacterium]
MKIKLLFLICLFGFLKLNAQDSISIQGSLIQYSSEKELMQIHPMLQVKQEALLEKKTGNAIQLMSSKKTRLFICLILLSLFGLIKLFHPKFIADLYAQFLKAPLDKRSKYDVLFQNKWPVFFLHLFYYLLMGILLASIFSNFSNSFSFNFQNVFITTLVYLCISFLRKILMKLIGWMLSLQKSEKIISQKISQLNISSVILFLILTSILLVFNGEHFKWFNILNLVILLIFIFIKHIILYANVTKKQNISVIQFLFYLCALEVLPILMLGRYLIGKWGA